MMGAGWWLVAAGQVPGVAAATAGAVIAATPAATHIFHFRAGGRVDEAGLQWPRLTAVWNHAGWRCSTRGEHEKNVPGHGRGYREGRRLGRSSLR